MSNILDLKPDFKDNPQLFIDLGKVEGFVEYLRKTADADIRRYFGAPDDRQRDMLRGHYQFSKGLIDNILRYKKKNLTNE